MVGQLDSDLFLADKALMYRGEDLTVLRSGEPWQFERDVTELDGDHTYLVVKFPLFDANGTAYGTSGIATDITDRKRAELERRALEGRLHQSQRLESLGQLAGGVAHDFNNLLNVILNCATFVAEETTGTIRDDAEQIRTAAESAARLTRQLLIFGRREAVQPKQLELNVLVEEIRGLLARSIGENVDLVVRTEASLPAIYADRGQIDQVMLNLAVNARDAMPGGGVLTVATRSVDLDDDYARVHPDSQPGRHVELSVTDTGSGMSAEVVARVFEPFYTTKPQGEGTGLGLATVYGIVAEAGGSVALQSELGVGTTFRVYLPASTTDASVSPDDRVVLPTGDGETILVVENEPAMLAVTVRLLERNGYLVVPAASADEAVALASATEIQLVLTNALLPRLSGAQLVERLREAHPDLAVLFMSGHTRSPLASTAFAADDIALIQKPFTEHDLLVKVKAVLAAGSLV
jgi:signal transduction histidine kinase/CheY-like chemotaxis protein